MTNIIKSTEESLIVEIHTLPGDSHIINPANKYIQVSSNMI